jgi:pimeloyl-ACP methyl ester carboxylesterase
VPTQERSISFALEDANLEADIHIGAKATGVVLFVHGSGSSRHSPRNQFVASSLRERQLGTVLMDLLTPDEERADDFTGHVRFDIAFLARRVTAVIDRMRDESTLPFGLFGASTGAAAAIVAAAARPAVIAAIVSRGGRPDLGGYALASVTAPTLLIVGSADPEVLELNKKAMSRMTQAEVRLEVVPRGSHLFQEPGTLEHVARLAGEWFTRHLAGRQRTDAKAITQNQ